LKVEVSDLNSCKKAVAIEVEGDALHEDFNAVCSRFQAQGKVPGFRPGKAPMTVIKQRYKDAIREDFLERVVQKFFVEAIREEKLAPLGSPHVHDLHYEDGQPLRFKAEFEVLPTLDISEYKGVEIEKIEVTVTDQEVESAIEMMREQMAEFLPVEDRALETGDFAVITYSSKYLDSSKAGPEAKEVHVEVGGPKTPPEFNQALPGMKSGESKAITVKYPADFPNKNLVGKELEYTVELKAIKVKRVPELTDEFAKDVGANVSVADLREKTRQEILENRQLSARRQMENQLLSKIIASHAFDVPDIMVKEQLEIRMRNYVQSLMAQGVPPQALESSWEELQGRQRDQAVEDVKAALVLDHVADKEKVEVSEAEVESEVERLAASSKQTVEAVRSRLTKDAGMDRIKDRIRSRKSLDLLFSLATFKPSEGAIVQP
jgi:trigger factor